MAKNDEAIKALLTKVEEQTAALGNRPRGTWRTNGVFKFSKDDYFNINVECSLSRFADAAGFLLQKANSRLGGAQAIGILDTMFFWDSYSVEDWISDFKTRVSIISYNDRKKVLDATKAKLHGLVSEEARTEMELEQISKTLNE